MNWSSTEGASSCETASVALTEVASVAPSNVLMPAAPSSPPGSEQHLVNRRALLERAGLQDEAGKKAK